MDVEKRLEKREAWEKDCFVVSEEMEVKKELPRASASARCDVVVGGGWWVSKDG
jgi:hypothetical protein